MSVNHILEIENLNVHYGDFQAIFDMSMRFERGKIISIIGSNGAGKSTLLNSIMGLHKQSSGKINFDGHDISSMKTSRIVGRGISMSPEGSMIFESMSVRENLLMGAYLPRAKAKKEELLERVFGLFPALKEKSGQLATFLSGGQRQMLALSRAIMADPKVLICDEVSLGLAPIIIKDIYDKIKEVNMEGMTVVLVEQEVKRSLKYSDFSYVIVKGRVVMEGISKDLPFEEVQDAYFGINKYA